MVLTRLRIAIEQREARQIMHQAEARHVRTHSAFEHRVIVGAEFHFHRIEFVFADALVLHLANHLVELGNRLLGA